MDAARVAQPGEASAGSRTDREPAEAPAGFAIPLKQVEDDDQGLNLEIKSSNEVLADELLRVEAKFQSRAVAEASKELSKDSDDPN